MPTSSARPPARFDSLDVFDFQLADEEIAAIDAFETGRRGGPEPEDITLASFGMPIPEH